MGLLQNKRKNAYFSQILKNTCTRLPVFPRAEGEPRPERERRRSPFGQGGGLEAGVMPPRGGDVLLNIEVAVAQAAPGGSSWVRRLVLQAAQWVLPPSPAPKTRLPIRVRRSLASRLFLRFALWLLRVGATSQGPGHRAAVALRFHGELRTSNGSRRSTYIHLLKYFLFYEACVYFVKFEKNTMALLYHAFSPLRTLYDQRKLSYCALAGHAVVSSSAGAGDL